MDFNGFWRLTHLHSLPVMIDIDLLARCGGLRVLLHSLAEAPGEFTPLLASTFLYIVDLPRTRCYLRPGSDLEVWLQPVPSVSVTLRHPQMALTGITDAYGKGLEYSDRMRACTRVVAMMLRTWSGSCCFRALRKSLTTISSLQALSISAWIT